MPSWLIGLAATLVAGVAASLYFWLIRRPRDEMSQGLHALSGLRWREFSRLVLAAMERRGLVVASQDDDEPREPMSTFLLARGDERWLLSCKHGSAYRIAAAPVMELAASIRLGAAQGGIVATEGKVEKEGRDAAQGNNIEVLDGPRLWPEVRSLIEPGLRHQITDYAAARAKRHTGIAWLAALALGAGVTAAFGSGHWLSLTGDAGGSVAEAAPTPRRAPTPARAGAVVAAPSATEAAAPALDDPSEEELEQQRRAVLTALKKTPGISSATWQTKLTLSVDRIGGEKDIWPWVCLELERYPALRTTRVQLNPPPGSNEPVRWRQCKTM